MNENFLAEYFNKEVLDAIIQQQKKDAEDIEEKEDEEDDD